MRLDYLALLLAALTSRGLDYRVAGGVQNIDITLPMLDRGTIQLVDSDVVLVRGDVHVAHVVTTNYQRALTLSALGITIPRGYVALDATLATHHTYRFVNTHLEPDDLIVQLAQAEERSRRSLEQLLRVSAIKSYKPMADYEWTWPTKIDRDVTERALTLDFLQEARNLCSSVVTGWAKP